MKMLASALALVLIGLTGGWLWIDAAADARETEGIVVVGALEQADGSASHARAAGDSGAAVITGHLVGAVQEGTRQLSGTFEQARSEAEQAAAEKEAAEKAAKEKAAQEKAAEEKAAEEKAAEERAAEEARQAEREAQEAQPAPAQVQPSPVLCRDDDEWEECDDDDWDDDWDD
ncbi:hypothetical protein [Serinicoccus hydrothermalis]|nr:hypothetical protein [Serinicoccus hydrothermalis]